jgi:hypothetical protein
VGGSSGGEDGLELGKGLGGDSITDTVVDGDGDLGLLVGLGVDELDRHGDDLGEEVTSLLGSDGLLVRVGSERILGLAADVELLSDVLTWKLRASASGLGQAKGWTHW